MTAGQQFECPICGPSERYANGLCAICSTEKEQIARDNYIDFVSGRSFANAHNGVYVAKSDKRHAEHMGMVVAGILYCASASTENITIFRVTDEYMQILEEKEKRQ